MSTAGRVIGVVASGSSVRGTHRVSRVAPGPRRRVRNAAQFIDYRRKPFTGKPTATASPSSSSEDEGYLTLLADKTEKVRTLFGEGGFIPASGVEVYASPKTRGYRSRCRFAIARDDSGALRYALFENGEVVMLGDDDDGEEDEDVFPWASEPIARAMPVLLELLNASDETNGVASKGLSAVGFLASRGGEVVVTLWNTLNRQGDEDANGVPDATWNDDANALLSRLRDVNVVGVVTRRRGKNSHRVRRSEPRVGTHGRPRGRPRGFVPGE
jgi:tRNA (uracil-5-)-methyltransferase